MVSDDYWMMSALYWTVSHDNIMLSDNNWMVSYDFSIKTNDYLNGV